MTDDASSERTRYGPWRGLSGKVLLLTIVFVMLGEVMIFLPSIANFRIQWLKGRIAQAEIAALAAEAAPDQILSTDLRSEILKGAGVLVVSLQKGESRKLALRADGDFMIDASYDLRNFKWYGAIMDAFETLFMGGDRVIGVTDLPPTASGDMIEIALTEAPLRSAMLGYATNILILSIVLSLLVASMIYVALSIVLVRPIKRLTRNMMAFARNPENRSRIVQPTRRRDEIGMAEHELQAMQTELANMLNQKNHLAALGLAVSKVSHDLRNMLTSAQLISDRLSTVNDPTVQRFTPKLISSLDRAIGFLSQTLRFGRAQEREPARERLNLHDACAEVIEAAELQPQVKIAFRNDIDRHIAIDADREQLNRILTNLTRNAIQALEAAGQEQALDGEIIYEGNRTGSLTTIVICDNGPGLPQQIRSRLFEAFQTASREGGTGLGLAIAAELVAAHGGEIEVEETSTQGTRFRIAIPDRVAEMTPRSRDRQAAAQ
jgi:signal transduction histidine kinase